VSANLAAQASAARPDVCHELPAKLQSLCGGPDVTCTPLADAHARWEAVFATEPTMARAQTRLARAQAAGFAPVRIEHDTTCSNGYGVYEVATSRFTTRAAALELVSRAVASGFPHARTEES
jgi:hypothetical protein